MNLLGILINLRGNCDNQTYFLAVHTKVAKPLHGHS